VIALAVMFSLTLVGWVVTILVFVITICVMKRRVYDSRQSTTTDGMYVMHSAYYLTLHPQADYP